MVVSVIRGGPNYLRRGRRGRLRQNDAVHAIGGPAAWNVRTALWFKMDQSGKENVLHLRMGIEDPITSSMKASLLGTFSDRGQEGNARH